MTIGHIYQIINDKGLCYIGSSSLKNINLRYKRHISAYKSYLKNPLGPYCSSYIVLKSKPKFILLETIEYDDKEKLKLLEDEYIRLFRGMCVNIRYAKYSYPRYYYENELRIDSTI
jgi:hypothetical protein